MQLDDSKRDHKHRFFMSIISTNEEIAINLLRQEVETIVDYCGDYLFFQADHFLMEFIPLLPRGVIL